MDNNKVSHEVLENEIKHLQINMEKLNTTVEDLQRSQGLILAELTKYKGIIGGITLAASAVTTAIVLFFQYLKVRH